MRVAVINEFSAKEKNEYILAALEPFDMQVHNVGMSPDNSEQELTYIHTGLMAGLSLATKAADLVVGGCGTGQGFTISAMQYPGVYCGLITNSLDAWLFSQINDGNCVSLALNKGFGWAGDIELKYIFEKLFADTPGQGYPPQRSEIQKKSREILSKISIASHKSFTDTLTAIDPAILSHVVAHKPFIDFIQAHGEQGELKDLVLAKA